MFFSDIVGQDAVKEKLIKQAKENRVPHALMLAGPQGTGKLALAIAFAQYIMCENRTPSDSCGVCPACTKVSKLIHPDLHFVYPAKAGKDKSDTADDSTIEGQEDLLTVWRKMVLDNPYMIETDWYDAIDLNNKQGIISVATAGEVIRKLSLKSFESDSKVMIVWLAERMNVQAANKLLKLIEEPPAKTYFIMVSENPNLILKTILSRTQQVFVPPLSASAIAIALTERLGITPDRARDIGKVSNGSYHEALRLTRHNTNDYFEQYRNLMRLCYAKRYPDLLDWVDDISRLGREEQKEFLSYALKLTRESLMLNLGLDDISYLMGEESEFGKKFSPFLGIANVNQVTKTLAHAYECIAQNGNPQITFASMALQLAKHIGPATQT